MKAAVIHAPRDLRIEDLDIPSMGPHDVKVRIRAGGICGSDLHYYQHGGFGAVRLRQPMVPGHEIAGEVAEVGAEVTRVRPGDGVAVNPSQPCGHCRFCLAGQPNHCLDMRFLGSAMRMPHIQGGFREVLVCREAQAVPVPPGMSLHTAAFAEPLAVCPARRPPGRAVAGAAGAGDGRRANRGAVRPGGPVRRGAGDCGDRHRRRAPGRRPPPGRYGGAEHPPRTRRRWTATRRTRAGSIRCSRRPAAARRWPARWRSCGPAA